ncbi:MAG: hypothetical protein AB7R55_01230 [Gemmatimonadales bacterium]
MDDFERSRQDAIRLLCDAHAREELSLDQFESRLERLKQAPNRATVDAILADLEPWNDPLAPPADLVPHRTGQIRAEHADHGSPPVAPAEFVRLTSVFASTKRAGSWTVPLEIQGLVILGELTLDLRDAVFGSDLVDIDVSCTLGSFTLIVPAGTQIENEIEETLSSSTHSTRASRGVEPNGLLVRLRGRALLASVEIKEKLPAGAKGGASGFLQRLLGKPPG